MDFREFLDGLRAAPGDAAIALPTPDLEAYYGTLPGAPLPLFDMAGHALLHSTTPCTRSLHLDLGGDRASLGTLLAANWNRAVLALDAAGEMRMHAPFFGLYTPRLLAAGATLAQALAFLPLPVRSFTLRAATLAGALALLAQVRDRCFAETEGLVLLGDAALDGLFAEDALAPAMLRGIKPAHGAPGLVLWLAGLTGEGFDAVLARVTDAPRQRRATVWNALPFEQRFDASTGIAAAEPPERAALDCAGLVAALPHGETTGAAWRQVSGVAGGAAIPQLDYCLRLRGATLAQDPLALDWRGNLVVLPYHFEVRPCDLPGGPPPLPPLTEPGRVLGNRPGLAIAHAGELDVLLDRPAIGPRFVEQPAFWWLPQYFDYTHFLSELLPCLEFAFRHAEREGIASADLRIVVPASLPGYAAEMLALLGLEERNFVRHDVGQPLIFAELLVPGLVAHGSAGRTRRFDDFWARFAALQDARLGPRPARPTRRIFVSRRDETTYRNLLNEEVLFQMAAARGYEFQIGKALTMAEKVAAFREASHVVGPVGPGLYHAVFGYGGALGVLNPDTYDHMPGYLHHLAAARRFRLTYLFGTGLLSPNARYPAHGRIHGDFVIAPDRFARLLDALEEPHAG